MFWNAKTKAIIDIFWTELFLFSFISELKTDVYWWSGRWQTRRWGRVSHIGAGIILSASCSLPLFCFMFKVEVFIVSVHGPEFKRSECTLYYNITCLIQKDLH